MKKILCILLTLVMCLGIFASCGEPEAPAEEYNLAAAKLALEEAYKNYLVNPSSDYDLPAKSVIDGVSYEVTWTTDNANIKVTESSKKNYWTIDIPDANSTETTYKLTATIKAPDGTTTTLELTRTLPIYSNGGIVTELKENTPYKIFLDQKTLRKTFFALNTTQNNENKYINTDIDPKKAADYYVEIVDGGYKFYTMVGETKTYVYAKTTTTDGKTSKYIGLSAENSSVFTYDTTLNTYFTECDGYKYGVGTYNSFTTISISDSSFFTVNSVGNSQFVIGFMDKAYAETLTPSEGGYADAIEKTLAEANTIGAGTAEDTYTSQRYKITGTITEIKDATYGNVMITDGTNEFYVYGIMSEDGSKQYKDLAYKPVVGDTITMVGGLGNYKGAPQMKNGWLVAYTKGEGSGDQGGTTPENPGTTAELKENTAYKLFINQKTANGIFYALATTQNNENKFINTTANAAESVDFYVEIVDGGYKFYTMVGDAKTYMYAKTTTNDEGHVSKYLGFSTEGSVFTYNSTLGMFFTEINGAKYGVGTYGSYTTLSLSEEYRFTAESVGTSQFVMTVVESSKVDTTPTPDPDPTPDPTPDAPAAGAPEVGKGYTISATNGKGKIYVISTVASGRFQGTYTATEATVFYVEAAANANEYLLYFMDGTTKTYVIFGDTSSGASTTTNAAEATVFEWNTDKNTLAVAEDSNNRAFGVGADSTYDNFSSYDLVGAYNWGAFTPVEA